MIGPGLEGIYCGPAPLPAEIWLRWNLDPLLIAALAALAMTVRRSRAGALAVTVLVLAFVSPLCALSAALFSARVVHHVLMVAVAAPLLALAWPASRSASPALPFLISTAALWGWHWPPAYDLALSNQAVYWMMQVTLLASSLAFWRAVLRPGQPTASGLLWVSGGYMQMGLLGALLTFAPTAVYAVHAVAPLAWNLTPLADQQLGGLIMWGPSGLLFAAWGGLVARQGWQGLAKGKLTRGVA